MADFEMGAAPDDYFRRPENAVELARKVDALFENSDRAAHNVMEAMLGLANGEIWEKDPTSGVWAKVGEQDPEPAPPVVIYVSLGWVSASGEVGRVSAPIVDLDKERALRRPSVGQSPMPVATEAQ